jgi:hypothetical protein
MADHDDDSLDSRTAQSPGDMLHHRQTANFVKAFRQLRFHPGALAGGEDDSGYGYVGHLVKTTLAATVGRLRVCPFGAEKLKEKLGKMAICPFMSSITRWPNTFSPNYATLRLSPAPFGVSAGH